MKTLRSTLIDLLAQPERAALLKADEWNAALLQARRARLTAGLYWQLESFEQLKNVPPAAIAQLTAGQLVATQHQRATRWEVNRIVRALGELETKIVLLKGAAYTLAGLALSRGRLVSDVDILVPRATLEVVEEALRTHGWEPLEGDEYEDFYYRQWMHELPPLIHKERRSVLDVHHTILPPVGRLHPDPKLLLASARPLPGTALWTLSPEDMVLHAAAHLFQEGELSGALRDVLDLDLLLRHLGEHEFGFWKRLVPRAVQLQLGRPLYYALRYTQKIFNTPIPEQVLTETDAQRPAWPYRRMMDALVVRALADGSSRSWSGDWARWLLFARLHWLKMPLPLLVRHGLHKVGQSLK